MKSFEQQLVKSVVTGSCFSQNVNTAKLGTMLKKMGIDRLNASALANIGHMTMGTDDRVSMDDNTDQLFYQKEMEPSYKRAYDIFGKSWYNGPRYRTTLNRLLSCKQIVDEAELIAGHVSLSDVIGKDYQLLLDEGLHNITSLRPDTCKSISSFGWEITVLQPPTVYIKKDAYLVTVFSYMLYGAAITVPK